MLECPLECLKFKGPKHLGRLGWGVGGTTFDHARSCEVVSLSVVERFLNKY